MSIPPGEAGAPAHTCAWIEELPAFTVTVPVASVGHVPFATGIMVGSSPAPPPLDPEELEELEELEDGPPPEELEEVDDPEELDEVDAPEELEEVDDPEEPDEVDAPEELEEVDDPEELDPLDAPASGEPPPEELPLSPPELDPELPPLELSMGLPLEPSLVPQAARHIHKPTGTHGASACMNLFIADLFLRCIDQSNEPRILSRRVRYARPGKRKYSRRHPPLRVSLTPDIDHLVPMPGAGPTPMPERVHVDLLVRVAARGGVWQESPGVDLIRPKSHRRSTHLPEIPREAVRHSCLPTKICTS